MQKLGPIGTFGGLLPFTVAMGAGYLQRVICDVYSFVGRGVQGLRGLCPLKGAICGSLESVSSARNIENGESNKKEDIK